MLWGYRRCEAQSSHQNDIQCGNSISTNGSDSPRYQQNYKHRPFNKEKLQLCKKFTEYGYCPYQKRCKFAHGYHQLRKNNTTNMKYKTKECVTFIENGFCHYGSRCNFIHKDQASFNKQTTMIEAKANYRDIFYDIKIQSKIIPSLPKQ